jgi:glycosyltransferase involved in cell wall biosynthesis
VRPYPARLQGFDGGKLRRLEASSYPRPRAGWVEVGRNMSQRFQISVALATFNGGRYLDQQLQSIAAQSFLPAELVVGDDGSADDTAQIIEAFAERAPFPVKFIRNATRLGYAENFLTVTSECRSDLVAFCDQDDVWRKDKLQRCERQFHDPRILMCAHAASLIDQSGYRIGDFPQHRGRSYFPPNTLPPWGVFFGFSIVFRRKILTLADNVTRPHDNIVPGKLLAHDRWVYFLASSLGFSRYLPQRLADYRQHGENQFGALSARSSMARNTLGLPAYHRWHVELALQRAQVLEKIAKERHVLAAQSSASAKYWTTVASFHARRAVLASEKSWRRKAAILADLAHQGGYAPFCRGGLSSRALARDLLDSFSRS